MGLRHTLTDNTLGPNERHFETIERMPGLSDPEAAYEAGRALRMIGYILEHSPVEHGQHFLSQLANAVLSFALRGERQPWGAEDTAFVFRETFKAAPTDAQRADNATLHLRAQAAGRQNEIALRPAELPPITFMTPQTAG